MATPSSDTVPLHAGLSQEDPRRCGSRQGLRARGAIAHSMTDIARAAASNPFPEGEEDPAKLHLLLPRHRHPRNGPTSEALEGLYAPAASASSSGRVSSTLHAPDGIGRSKMAARVEEGTRRSEPRDATGAPFRRSWN